MQGIIHYAKYYILICLSYVVNISFFQVVRYDVYDYLWKKS